jgi:hypothetical protein
MTIWKYDMCSQCGGDLYITRDMDGWYEKCIHCSYRHSLRTADDFAKALTHKEEDSLSSETSNCPDMTNWQYLAAEDRNPISSTNLLNSTVQIQTASFSLN